MVRRFHYTAHGVAHGANALGPNAYLFQVSLPKEDGDAELLDAFKVWVVDHAAEIGLAPGLTVGDLGGLVTSAIPSSRNAASRAFTFEQVHEGLPIDGPSRWVRLRVADDTRVEAWEGELVDGRHDFTRRRIHIGERRARAAVVKAWCDAGHGVVEALGPLELRASSAYRTHIYRTTVLGAPVGDARPEVGTVAIHAFTGATLVVKRREAYFDAEVTAPAMSSDPLTASLVTHLVPTKTYGTDLGLGCEPPAFRRNYRLGDESRLATWTFEGSYNPPHEVTAQGCSDGSPPPAFDEDSPDSEGLRSQTMHVVAKRMSEVIDRLMGEMLTHGSTHSYSWDHHPSTPEVAHRAPLVVFTNRGQAPGGGNACDSQNGVFRVYLTPENSPSFQDLEAPMPTPLLFGADGAYHLPTVNACNHRVGAMLHELGHYYDNYNSYGTSGDDGQTYSVCCLDRPHEATTMRETIGQLFALYGYRRLYPGLSYTLHTLADPAAHCDLSELQGFMPKVVHQSCIDVVKEFHVLNDQRPTANDPPNGCKVSGSTGGYAVHAITQAYWELLFGVWCDGSGTNVTCGDGTTSASYADRWMEALLAALDMGNAQSFVQLWDNMGAFIQTNYPADYALFDHVRELHGIQPLPHGLDPACGCPQLDGTCVP